MRWYWIDRFLEFESGRYAKAVKNVSLAEDYLHDHFPDYPVLPKSLVIEGLAQTGGLLVCEHTQFAERVVLAKIPFARFHCEAVPGDQLVYTATILAVKEDGAMVTAVSHKDGQLQAEMEIVFAHLGSEHAERLYDPETFLRMMRMLGAFEVGHAADGGPLVPPARLLDAVHAGDSGQSMR
jgi:3-hydroxyacyl-[acyl-carrier-protein] dehydratase